MLLDSVPSAVSSGSAAQASTGRSGSLTAQAGSYSCGPAQQAGRWGTQPGSAALTFSGHTEAINSDETRRGWMVESPDALIQQVSGLLRQAREQSRAAPGENGGDDSRTRSVLTQTLRLLLMRKSDSGSSDYLEKLAQAYTLLFPGCLAGVDLERQVQQTIQHLLLMSETALNQEYARLNRSNNQRLRQMILGFTRLDALKSGGVVPQLTEGECVLAVFLQRLRQNLGAQVLKNPHFRASYREALLSSLRSRYHEDPETRWDTVRAWLGEAMRSFDPLQAYGQSGHDRSTFIAWAREVIQNRQNDEARRYLRREADQFLFIGHEAVRLFRSRWQALPIQVRNGLDQVSCLKFIEMVQTSVPPSHWRPTLRLRRRIAELTGWSLEQTVEIHEQVRRVLEQYVQATLPLNDQFPYPSPNSLDGPEEPLAFITQFLEDPGTPEWVRDWCNQHRTQAEIARLLCVSQPTVSRCLRREYRDWLYRSFLRDAQTPKWMQRWYETRNLPDSSRRQERRAISTDYASGQTSVQGIDQAIEAALQVWCDLNDVRYLTA